MKRGKSTKIHLFLLLVIAAVFIWSVIKPAEYLTWVLEVSPAVIGLIIVIAIYKKFRLTTLSYIIIAILAIMMFVGGHYTYSDVPLFNNWIKDVFDFKRNHYDRFGHLLKGSFTIVIREILLRKTPLTKGPWLVAIVISISLAIASLYEIIEWLSTLINGRKATKNFLGTQGDIWDAQWDMLLTLVGSIFALLILSKLHNRLLKKELTKE